MKESLIIKEVKKNLCIGDVKFETDYIQINDLLEILDKIRKDRQIALFHSSKNPNWEADWYKKWFSFGEG